MNKKIIITIDGPGGAGKSTIAKMLAQNLGYSLLDTGAIYRTLAYLARKSGIDWGDEPALAELAVSLPISFEMRCMINHVLLNGQDITDAIRTPEISMGASQVSAFPMVRKALLSLQRSMGERGGIVIEGRDTGTVVFPKADKKIFLTASLDIRASRRQKELQDKGIKATIQSVLEEIRQRDLQDSSRQVAPLIKADDALEIDTTTLSIDEVIATIMKQIGYET